MDLPPNKAVEDMSGLQTMPLCTSLRVQEPPDSTSETAPDSEQSREIEQSSRGEKFVIVTKGREGG